MGGPGSGRGSDGLGGEKSSKAEARKAATAAALALQTPETKTFLAQQKKGKGDRVFEVVRCYSDGSKVTVGQIKSVKVAELGARFGGGEYEISELDRATELPTGNVIRKFLHPAQWPPKNNFELEPAEYESAMAAAEQPGPGRAQNPDLAGLTREQIFEKAVKDVTEKMQAEQRQQRLNDQVEALKVQIAELTNRISSGGAGGGSFTQQAAEFFDLFKKMTPAPQVQTGSSDPTFALTQMLATIKSFKENASELSFLAGNPDKSMLGEKLISSLTGIADTAIKHFASRPGAGQPQQQPAAGVTATETPLEQVKATDEEIQIVLTELSKNLAGYQADQLSPVPKTHISQAAGWVTAQWNNPSAVTAWKNLRISIRTYSTDELVTFISTMKPELVDTPEKKNWFAALVDVLKKEA